MTLPKYEPEINHDSDADKYAHGIHVAVPEDLKDVYFNFIETISSTLYEKVLQHNTKHIIAEQFCFYTCLVLAKWNPGRIL